MTLEKAIEILSDEVKASADIRDPDLKHALKIGIEALARLQASRLHRLADFIDLLPGETKE